MGCSNAHFEDIIEKIMSQFFFRKIRHDFTVSHIEDYIHKPVKTYYEFLSLIKVLGVHNDIDFQNTFWEKCYVTHIDKYGIDGVLFLPLLLCNGDIRTKLDYIKEYLSVNINHSKEANLSTLIMTLNDFQNIIFTYLSCLTTIAFESYINVNSIEDSINNPANVNSDKKIQELEKFQQCFSPQQIEFFTKRILRPYSKKNFYVNAGKFLQDNIDLLVDDNLIRNMIIEWYEKGKSQEEVVNKMKKELSDDESEENNDGNLEGEIPEPKVETGMIQRI